MNIQSSSMHEYWIGKDIKYAQIWNDYNTGKDGFITKFDQMKVSLLEINFDFPSIDYPIFNHEAIYKTIKGIYHDFKLSTLSKTDYQNSGPIFLYEIQRGSVDWSFLLDAANASQFIMTIYFGYLHRKKMLLNIEESQLNIFTKKLEIFTNIAHDPEKLEAAKEFIKSAPKDLQIGIDNLCKDITGIKLTNSFNPNNRSTNENLKLVFKESININRPMK